MRTGTDEASARLTAVEIEAYVAVMKSGLRTRTGSSWVDAGRDGSPSAPLQTDDVRVANRRAILHALADGTPASRATLALRTGADAHLLSSQLSIHPSHGERLIKIFGHDHHEVCEPG